MVRMSSSSDTRGLIEQAVHHLATELPALRQLRLVVRLELKSRGESPIWRVELPEPKVTKDAASDARVDVSVIRANFNELAKDGTLKQWVKAYERGQVQISGDPSVVKLVGNVIARHIARARA
jgi:hypothetical protein